MHALGVQALELCPRVPLHVGFIRCVDGCSQGRSRPLWHICCEVGKYLDTREQTTDS